MIALFSGSRVRSIGLTVALLMTGPYAWGHVSLEAPNGGESLEVGSEFTIRWRVVIQHSTQGWNLSYSNSGAGGPWIPIATELAVGDPSAGSTHTFSWTVPDDATTQARVQVVMVNALVNYTDISSGDFAIEAPAECGDGVVDPGEECDDGNTLDGDGCSSACMIEAGGVCGDGVVDAGEECDDGNTDDGDGCGSACEVESGWECSGEPSVCTLGCCVGRVGDANGLGGDEPTIGDVSVMIDAKFITGACDGILNCLDEADINQSGGIGASCDDITIGDISTLIDYLFITGTSLGLADCL